jgi:hypothetical protein
LSKDCAGFWLSFKARQGAHNRFMKPLPQHRSWAKRQARLDDYLFPRPLEDNIWFLLNNQNLREQYASNAADIFRKRFSIENMMGKYENLYTQLYNENKRARIAGE